MILDSLPNSLYLPENSQVGDYRIESILGEGGVAMVYRARRIADQSTAADHPSTVALKVLKPEAVQQPHVLACFQFEARVLSRLNHPNILQVYTAGVDKEYLYTAMEKVDGVSFDRFLLAKKRLPQAFAAQVASQLADALHYLHEHRYVHRDIKPANLMLADADRILLFDFGTVIRADSRAAYEKGIYGTPAFMAPEQIEVGGPVDGRADLYALGLTLYLMVTGRKPFYGSRNEVLAAQLHAPPPPPSQFARVSPALEAIILKALAKDPADRFQSGAEFAQALTAAVASAPPAPTLRQRLLSWLRIHS